MHQMFLDFLLEGWLLPGRQQPELIDHQPLPIQFVLKLCLWVPLFLGLQKGILKAGLAFFGYGLLVDSLVLRNGLSWVLLLVDFDELLASMEDEFVPEFGV